MESPAFFTAQEHRFHRLPADHTAQRDLSAVLTGGVWDIVVGPHDTDAFLDEFRDLATQGTIGADLVVGDEDPVDVWLSRLRQGPYFHTIDGSVTIGEVARVSDGGYIDFLCVASAKCCVKLQTLALAKHRQGTDRSTAGQDEAFIEEATSEEPSVPRNLFRQTHSGRWEVAFEGQHKSGLSDLAGMKLIQTLLQDPGKKVPATFFMSPSGGTVPDTDVKELGASGQLAAGLPRFDDKTRRELEQRRQELKDEAELAGETHSVERLSGIREEIERLDDYLRKNSGLGGRPRQDGSDVGRARTAARERFVRALNHLR